HRDGQRSRGTDQPAGVERRRGSCTCRRARSRLLGGGRRGSQSGRPVEEGDGPGAADPGGDPASDECRRDDDGAGDPAGGGGSRADPGSGRNDPNARGSGQRSGAGGRSDRRVGRPTGRWNVTDPAGHREHPGSDAADARGHAPERAGGDGASPSGRPAARHRRAERRPRVHQAREGVNRDVLTARLRALFVAELEDRLETLNADLLSLEANPGSAERLDSVFRVFHTLKGAAHAAAVPQVETVCHAAEALLVRAREGALLLGPEEFRDLFAVADSLADAARRLKEGRELTASPLAEPRRAGDSPASAPPAAAPEDPGTDRTPTAVSGSARPPANDPARDTPPRPVPSGAHGGDGGADQV